jgi:hypothetical protein
VTLPNESSPSPSIVDHEEAAPSRQDLLQRAAALGPRMTWASIRIDSSDPILGAKMLPRVVERRARFRRVVKVALGACVACCMVATVASAFSSTTAPDTSSPSAARNASTVPVETLELGERTKAPGHVVATIRPASAPKHAKRR